MNLKIKKYVSFLGLLMLAIVLFSACGSYADKIKNHKAALKFDEGVVTKRYGELALGENDERIYRVTYNVNRDMTEEDMLDVLEYEEMIYNAECDEVTGEYTGERDKDYICYALFCEGTSNEVIGKNKYVNYECEDYTEEDEYLFLNPIFKRQ